MTSRAPRVTEAANPLTVGLEAANPRAFLRLLCACDAQLFVGSDGLPSMYDAEVLAACAASARAVGSALAHARGRVVFAGCGTSGRLAHLLARVYNAAAGGGTRFGYLLAGGDAALLVPAESVEDDPHAGAGDLRAWAEREGVRADDPVVVFGVSCGLSATYVASLLSAAHARGAPSFAAAVGFNALEAIAHVAVPGAGVTFAAVLAALQTDARTGAVINPVVGAEAVAGSSRMKGGSATLVLLRAVCDAGVALAGGAPLDTAALVDVLRASLGEAEAAVRALYALGTPAIEDVLCSASTALCTPCSAGEGAPQRASGGAFVTPSATGRLLYVGRSHAGLLGIVDASEATDTYGSRFNDLRAFTAGGWGAMSVAPAASDPLVPPELRGGGHEDERACPDLRAFFTDFAPTLHPLDCVVALWGACDGDGVAPATAAAEDEELLRALSVARAAGARAHFLAVGCSERGAAEASEFVARAHALGVSGLALDVPSRGSAPPLLALLALKLALNAVSTGAHVARGVVIGNRMGNMMLTNHKLFLRAIDTVDALARCGLGAARAAVLRAVNGEDAPARVAALVRETEEDPVTVLAHVARASVTERVIPVAVLLAMHELTACGGGGGLSVAAARTALEKHPKVSDALRAVSVV